MQNLRHTLTSESVSEGHPDKVCDYIADSILDAYLAGDPRSRVACEVLCKDDKVVIAGEITSKTAVDHEAVARRAIREIGYLHDGEAFHADRVRVFNYISRQSDHIAQGVDEGRGLDKEQGAGDQGMMFGYATAETPELMPLPILLSHRLTRGLADDRRSGSYPWLRPDAKSQVSVEYENGTPVGVTCVLVSTQHAAGDAVPGDLRLRGHLAWPPACSGSGSRPGCRCWSTPPGRSRSAGHRRTAASPAGRSSWTPTAAPRTTAAARSAARTRRRWTGAARTSAATWPGRS